MNIIRTIISALAVGSIAPICGGTLQIEKAKLFPNFGGAELTGTSAHDLGYHKVADLNKDGRPDILTITSVPLNDLFNLGGVRVYLQQADGSFVLQGDYSVSDATSLTVLDLNMEIMVADFNGDTHEDFIVSEFGSTNLLLFPGNGDGDFLDPIRLDITVAGNSVTFADFNQDLHLDLVAQGASGEVTIFNGDGSGGFTEGKTLPIDGTPGKIQAVDVNNDGRTDLLVASLSESSPKQRTLHTFLGQAGGTFDMAKTTEMGTGASRSDFLADFNGDGKVDYVAADRETPNVTLWLGSGEGTFTRQSTVSHPAPVRVAAGDLNGDGILDLVVGSTVAAGQSLAIFPGNGDGTFQSRKSFSPGGGRVGGWTEVKDMNGDGRADLVIFGGSASVLNSLTIALNKGFLPNAQTSALITLDGFDAGAKILEWSTDLVIWTPLATNNTTAAWRYNHAPQNQPLRFYRVKAD